MPNESLVPKLFMLDGEQAKLVMTEIESLLEKELSTLNTEVQQYRQQIATTLASSLKMAAEYCHSDYESLQETELLAKVFEFTISDMAKIECINQKLAYILEMPQRLIFSASKMSAISIESAVNSLVNKRDRVLGNAYFSVTSPV
ncbi:hypothetical protein RGL65_001409 [Vibrio parahaemolyticus]|nr:hypothetical protein [Vibrio parahaemolyticus]ELA8197427.1 hypothetical protein [Vibrio parahaemolyticus]